MKHFKLLILLIVAVLISSSCKKSSVPPAPTIGMSFKVNGTLVKTDFQEAILYTEAKVLNVDGAYNNKSTNISISVINPQVGTFDGIYNQVQIVIGDSQTNYGGNTGTVTITALSDKSVSGTFQFSFYSPTKEMVNITEGQFTSNLINQ
jgi:hypothetical protein